MNNDVRLNSPSLHSSGNKIRESNLELFRIITMLFIIANHYVVNSGLTKSIIFIDPFSWKSLFIMIIGAWGKTGINCFVLITGYFMCCSTISAKKFFKVFFTVLFYNTVILCIFSITGYQSYTLKSALSIIAPMGTVKTDFRSSFLFSIFLYLLSIS